MAQPCPRCRFYVVRITLPDDHVPLRGAQIERGIESHFDVEGVIVAESCVACAFAGRMEPFGHECDRRES